MLTWPQEFCTEHSASTLGPVGVYNTCKQAGLGLHCCNIPYITMSITLHANETEQLCTSGQVLGRPSNPTLIIGATWLQL